MHHIFFIIDSEGGGLQELTSTVKLIQLLKNTDRLSILVELVGLNFMIKINLNYMSPELV